MIGSFSDFESLLDGRRDRLTGSSNSSSVRMIRWNLFQAVLACPCGCGNPIWLDLVPVMVNTGGATVCGYLGTVSMADRRFLQSLRAQAWPRGVVLIIDQLSEGLNGRPSPMPTRPAARFVKSTAFTRAAVTTLRERFKQRVLLSWPWIREGLRRGQTCLPILAAAVTCLAESVASSPSPSRASRPAAFAARSIALNSAARRRSAATLRP
jgi:hypothetical protein